MDQFSHIGEIEDEAPVEPTPPPKSLDFELDPPVEFAKKRFTTLHLREPTALQSQRAEEELGNTTNPFAFRKYQIMLVAQAARVPKEVVQSMRTTEVEEAFDFLSKLLANGPAITRTSSPTSRGSGAGDPSTPGS